MPNMGNQFLSLSLFIMLLAFFIVLNTMSDFDISKTKPVLNSLNLAFSQNDVADTLEPGPVADRSEARGEGDALDKLDSLFRAQISGIKIARNRLGTQMHMRMPAEDFEQAIFGPSPMNSRFIPVLISILDAADSTKYRMDIVLNLDETAAVTYSSTPAFAKQKVTQTARYADRLQQTGLSKKLITTGLGRGEDGYIDLFFRRYAPFNPVQTGTPGNSESTL